MLKSSTKAFGDRKTGVDTNRKHVVTSLSYYDGHLEGFVQSLRDHGICYFKILAWDGWQDIRLFAVTQLDQSSIDELIELLALEDHTLNEDGWVLPFRFRAAD